MKRWAGVVIMASMVIAPACGSDEDAQAPPVEPVDDASASVGGMVGSLSADEPLGGTYFSFERYATGSGLNPDGSPEEVLTKIFVERSADATVGEPFGAALKLAQLDKLVIDPASVIATYDQQGANLVTVMRGEFDADVFVKRSEAIIDEAGFDQTVAVTSESDGDFQRLSLSGAEPSDDEPVDEGPGQSPSKLIPGLMSSDSLAVSDDRLLVLPQGLDIPEVLADGPDRTALGDDGVEALTAALDDAAVYAAFLSLTPVTPEGGEEALVGGFGTGFVDGDEHAYTVLVHEDDGAAKSNGEAVATIMADDADCSVEAVVQLEGPLMVASCPVEKAGWARFVAGRVGLSPFYA